MKNKVNSCKQNLMKEYTLYDLNKLSKFFFINNSRNNI